MCQSVNKGSYTKHCCMMFYVTSLVPTVPMLWMPKLNYIGITKTTTNNIIEYFLYNILWQITLKHNVGRYNGIFTLDNILHLKVLLAINDFDMINTFRDRDQLYCLIITITVRFYQRDKSSLIKQMWLYGVKIQDM